MSFKLRAPGGERTWLAGMFVVLALAILIKDVVIDAVVARKLLVTLGLLSAGIGLWFKQQWARWLVVVFLCWFGIKCALDVVSAGFQWKPLLLGGGAFYTAWSVWKQFSPAQITADEQTDKPMVSLVLLLREPRYLEATILANIVSSAWGGDYSSSEGDDGKDGFVVGESPLFAINSSDGFYVLNNFERCYFDDIEGVLKDITELRLRKALTEHRAWLSVDLIRLNDDNLAPETAYQKIAQLIAELGGADCLAILQPATGKVNVWDADLEAKLRGPNSMAEFAIPTNVPVVRIEEDDPRMLAAVKEARSRWPEFVEAFKKKDGQKFGVKAPISEGGNTEFIWVEVTGLEPDYIHGQLGNDPVDLGDLKLGDRVEVPLKDLNDWGFIRAGEPVGMFTVKVLAEAQKQARS